MIEMIVYGRGGQGGVTLAKLVATAYFLRGRHVQAFGLYAAERSGAPIQAFVRVDDEEITNHNQIRTPDHVIALDRTLIGARVLTGLKPGGWIILNTPQPPEAFADLFPGFGVATVDATHIAVENGLGTRAVPIVNTTMLGAVARALGLDTHDMNAALEELRFGGGNVSAARSAYEQVRLSLLPGEVRSDRAPAVPGRVTGLLDDDVGGVPRIRTGTWATQAPQRHQLTPPCQVGCPAGNDIQGFVQSLTREDADGALEILLRTSPFPGVCGRVCPAPCMEACNRSTFDESVNIRELERFAADHGHRADAAQPWRQERVAVVGSGPAGLSAAFALARLGYPVVLFEAGHELGGVMRTGIPEYRLPRTVLDAEIGYILAHGVEVHRGMRVGPAQLLRLSHEYAAVFVGTGLQQMARLEGLKGVDRATVEEGIEFLDRARRREVTCDGERVAVIGGGNTAIDAARTALRLGAASVRILYRRTRAEMPAIAEEVNEGLEEGVVLEELVMPLTLRANGSSALLTCTRMKLGEPDASGRPRPIPETTEDAQFDVPCHRVILALGQSADLSVLPEGTEVHEGETLLGLIGAPVFAGGDLATNEGTVSAAIGSGRRAALHIHRTLTGEDLLPPPARQVAGPEVMHMHVFSHAPRQSGTALRPSWRKRNFAEVRLGLAHEAGFDQSAAEAERCFSCGVCNSCDRCVTHCPEGILVREKDGYRFDYDYCKGCGICAAQCPRGVIYLAEL